MASLGGARRGILSGRGGVGGGCRVGGRRGWLVDVMVDVIGWLIDWVNDV